MMVGQMGFRYHQSLLECLQAGHRMGRIRGDIPVIHLEARSHLVLGIQEDSERHSHREVDKKIDYLETQNCRCSTF